MNDGKWNFHPVGPTTTAEGLISREARGFAANIKIQRNKADTFSLFRPLPGNHCVVWLGRKLGFVG